MARACRVDTANREIRVKVIDEAAARICSKRYNLMYQQFHICFGLALWSRCRTQRVTQRPDELLAWAEGLMKGQEKVLGSGGGIRSILAGCQGRMFRGNRLRQGDRPFLD